MIARQRGLTLIEVMVTLAIVAALVGVAAPSINSWIINSRVRSATEAIANGLRFAHSEAVRRNGLVTFRMTSTANVDWIVETDIGGTTTTLQSFNAAQVANSNEVVVTRTPATLTSIRFNGLGRSVPPAPPSTDVLQRIDITTSQGDATSRRPLRVMVGAAGAIRMCDPSPALVGRTPPDPRAC
jgi:type IV fimbrial biogenesis protein FimT